MRLRRPVRAFAVLMCALGIAGCAGTARERVFDDDGPTVEQVWHGAAAHTDLAGDRAGFNPGGASGAAAWTRDAENELDALFPTLHNPRLGLYVFPHLTADGHPVPGYVTTFFLYGESRIWALPGEAFREGTWR